MKTITKLTIILSLLIIALITNAKPHYTTADQLEATQPIAVSVVPESFYTDSSDTQLTSESYTVTNVTDNPTNNDEYYAEKSDGTGVFFTSSYIQSIGQISIGDTVNVFYDGEDLAYVSAN